MIDWESDPELKAMRAEFVASLVPRQKALADHKVAQPLPLEAIRMIAHKIGGAAGSYGFPTLSEIGGAIDDLASEIMKKPLTPKLTAQMISFIELLEEALALSLQGKDPKNLKSDPRFSTLNRAVELLLSESTTESS